MAEELWEDPDALQTLILNENTEGKSIHCSSGSSNSLDCATGHSRKKSLGNFQFHYSNDEEFKNSLKQYNNAMSSFGEAVQK